MTAPRPITGVSQVAAVLLTLGVLGAVTGLLPMAGLLAATRAPVAAPVVQPPAPPIVPVAIAPPVVGPVALSTTQATWPQASVSGPITVRTGTSDTVLPRGGDGTTWLVTTVEVGADPAATAPRQPIDLALVLDTSGSMAEMHGAVQAMPLLRRATLGLIERLGPEDRLVLIAYSSDARVLFEGPIGPEGHAQLEQIVSRLEATGGTNISEGLSEAVRGLERLAARPTSTSTDARETATALGAPDRPAAPRARRVLLLTDGKPTLGMTEPGALTALVAEQRTRGLALSTLGLGLAYNEDLLAAMADRGGGAYHYAATAEGLARVYQAELDAMRRLAARGVELTITLAPGAELVGVESWPTTTTGGVTRVALGDLSYGQTVKVVARVRAPKGAASGAPETLPLAHLAVGVAAGASGSESIADLPLGITLSDDPVQVEQGRVTGLADELKRVEVSRRLRDARAAAASGDRVRARALVREARDVGGDDEVRYSAPSGEGRSIDLRRMEEDLGSNDAPAAAGAMKVAAEADRALGR